MKNISELESIFYKWWARLTDDNNEGKHPDRAALAQLRRISVLDVGDGLEPDVAQALEIAAFRQLLKNIGGPLTDEKEKSLAVVAATLARVRKNIKGSTAQLLGGEKDEGPRMKEVRFLRLMRAKNTGDLLNQARHIAALVNYEAPVGELGASLYLWNSVAIRRKWARSYYHLDQFSSDSDNSNLLQGDNA